MRKQPPKRIQLGNYTFALNPESYNQAERTMINVQHTAGGGYVEHWGADFPRISMSGITGLGKLDELKKLRNEVRKWNTKVAQGAEPTLIEFHNFTDDEHALVAVLDFQLRKSTSRPTMYAYQAEMVVMRWLGDGVEESAALPLSDIKDEAQKILVAPPVSVIDLATGAGVKSVSVVELP